jgi:predicted RNA-binding protein with TRAM domain
MKYAVWMAVLITCLCVQSAQTQGSPVTLSFSANPIGVGTSSIIDVLIDCQVQSCAAADIRIAFDPNALRVEGMWLGDFPTSRGNTVYILDRIIEPDTATLSFRYITQGHENLESIGMGVLFHIAVVALHEGDTELRFTHASIASIDGQTVFTPQTLVGTIPLIAFQVTQTITVRAEASNPDSVAVMESDGNSIIVSETIVGDMLQVEINSNLDISAEIILDAPGHLACTLHIGENPSVILYSGDVNNDGTIDILDVTTIGIANSAISQDEVDLNHDGLVNIYDLIHVGRNYGLNSGEC